MKEFLKLFICIGICLLVGVGGSFFTITEIPVWYAGLNKPFFSPPNFIFGPVWTTLYVLMGISVYLVSKSGIKSNKIREAIYLFAFQLILNAIWSPIFFGLKSLGLAFVIIVLLWFYIFRTIAVFSHINKTASYLMYPYLAWVSFASVLNLSIWIMNR